VPRYFILTICSEGMVFAVGAACVADETGFQMKILVRSPMPKNQVPVDILDEIERWLDSVRKDYHQYHLMSLP